MRPHGCSRSSAAWRVRIALDPMGPGAGHVFYLLPLRHGGRRTPDDPRPNPQGPMPALETDGGEVLARSLSIRERLDATHPQPQPPLPPGGTPERARLRAFAPAIVCDIHPVQDLEGLARPRAIPPRRSPK